MKIRIMMVLGLAYLTSPAIALAAPNFSGSWVKDNSKSDPVPNPLLLREVPQGRGGGGGGLGRGGPGGRGGGPMPMVVVQEANTLQVTEPQGGARKVMLDGKPHAITMETGVQKATVVASWEGDALVISTTEPYGGMPGNVTAHVKETWSLSPDGNTLTVTTSRSIPAGEKTFKEVYQKK